MVNKKFDSIEYLVRQAVGFPVTVAVGTSKNNTPEYQIMPGTTDDEIAERYFDWYCDTKPNNQFHSDPVYAAGEFVMYFLHWRRTQNG